MTQQIYSLIPKVMADVPEIRKARQHSQQRWMYRGFEDFLAAFRPALLKHGLFIVPEVLGTETGEKGSKDKGTTMQHVIVTVAYSIFAPDGSMVRAVVIGESWDSQDNASTKALDDAFTTFLTQTFCVPTGEVPGEQQAESRQTGKQQRQQGPSRPEAVPPAPPASEMPETTIDAVIAALKKVESPAKVDEQISKWAKGRPLADLSEGELEKLFDQARNWLKARRVAAARQQAA